MAIAISSLVPNPDDLLALEVEEIAGVLLTYLTSSREGIAFQLGFARVPHPNVASFATLGWDSTTLVILGFFRNGANQKILP